MERGGFSVRELIPFVEREHLLNPQARVSRRVRWLSEAIEGKPFWISLYRHLAEDQGKRVSAGGVFFRQSGDLPVSPENSYTWSQVFSSLDTFLKKFDMRATEFFFRDFQPQNPDPELYRTILLARTLALNNYPRLRFLYWEDYQQILKTPTFWRRLHDDLSRLTEPVSQGRFFEVGNHKHPEKGKEKIYKFWVSESRIGKKAYFFDYPSFAQIVDEVCKKNPREFLLEYIPAASDTQLAREVEEAQGLLAKKVLPARELQPVTKMSKAEFDRTMQDRKFWQELVTDIENHAQSQDQTYSFATFLKNYDPEKQGIVPGKPKHYARLATVYLCSTKGLREKIAQPIQRLIHYLMWEFTPEKGELVVLVDQAKALCAEMFPQDCLYVILQTPQFWEMFTQDVQAMQGRHTLASFLRYFSRRNPSCDRRKYAPGKSKYQRLHHRAYHKQEQFLEFLGQLGLDAIDYKEGLAKLFLSTAPCKSRKILEDKFPDNYCKQEYARRQKSVKLYNQAKELLVKMMEKPGKTYVQCFRDQEKLYQYQAKLASAAKVLKIHVSTVAGEDLLEIKVVPRGLMTQKESAAYEEEITLYRRQGLSNASIARRLGLKEEQVSYLAGKLIKRKQIYSRRRLKTPELAKKTP